MKTEDKKALKKIVLVMASVIAIYSITLTTPVRKAFFSQEIRSYSNDDGSYRIAVYSIDDPFFVIRMPGSSGDRSGFVRLYNKENALLGEADVDMVAMVEEKSIYWSEDEVDIKLIATLPLPKSEEK